MAEPFFFACNPPLWHQQAAGSCNVWHGRAHDGELVLELGCNHIHVEIAEVLLEARMDTSDNAAIVILQSTQALAVVLVLGLAKIIAIVC